MEGYVITDELRDNLIKWFNNIADEASRLTPGNVSHLGANIKGMALRSAKFIEEFSIGIGDIAEDYK